MGWSPGAPAGASAIRLRFGASRTGPPHASGAEGFGRNEGLTERSATLAVFLTWGFDLDQRGDPQFYAKNWLVIGAGGEKVVRVISRHHRLPRCEFVPSGPNSKWHWLSWLSNTATKLTGVAYFISTKAAFEGNRADRAAEIGDRFEAVARARGVPFQYRAAARESASNLFVHSADLFVATQPHIDTAHLAYDAVPENSLLTVGVPGLILPCFWRKREIGKSVLVGWNASREATRAVHDALRLFSKRRNASLSSLFERHYDGKKNRTWTPSSRIWRIMGSKLAFEGWTDTGDIDAVSALFACLDADDIDLYCCRRLRTLPLG